jgi:AcrR family transcriptional regulator
MARSRDTRTRIVEVAADLLAEGGRDAVSTRAVAAAAGTQAPTLYRLFGDKDGLLEAVAEHGFTTFLARKQRPAPLDDPVEDLRAGWDFVLDFALENPELYALMYDEGRRARRSPTLEAGERVLLEKVRRVAAAGRLRVSERRAYDLIRATGTGVAFLLLAQSPAEREVALGRTAREAVLAAITTDGPADGAASGPAAAAITLLAALPDLDTLTDAEQHLLREWLERIAVSLAAAPASAS